MEMATQRKSKKVKDLQTMLCYAMLCCPILSYPMQVYEFISYS